jgi:hypothetical protein
MPATQRGQAYRLGANRWGLRYYDENGVRRRRSPFPSNPPRSPTTAMSSSRSYAASRFRRRN